MLFACLAFAVTGNQDRTSSIDSCIAREKSQCANRRLIRKWNVGQKRDIVSAALLFLVSNSHLAGIMNFPILKAFEELVEVVLMAELQRRCMSVGPTHA